MVLFRQRLYKPDESATNGKTSRRTQIAIARRTYIQRPQPRQRPHGQIYSKTAHPLLRAQQHRQNMDNVLPLPWLPMVERTRKRNKGKNKDFPGLTKFNQILSKTLGDLFNTSAKKLKDARFELDAPATPDPSPDTSTG